MTLFEWPRLFTFVGALLVGFIVFVFLLPVEPGDQRHRAKQLLTWHVVTLVSGVLILCISVFVFPEGWVSVLLGIFLIILIAVHGLAARARRATNLWFEQEHDRRSNG